MRDKTDGSVDEARAAQTEFHFNTKELLEKLSFLDHDNDGNITINDIRSRALLNLGGLAIEVPTNDSSRYNVHELRTQYAISNLLQECTLAQIRGQKEMRISKSVLTENPKDRLARKIRLEFWPNLTRRLDADNIAKCATDKKDPVQNARPRIYVPIGDPEQLAYWHKAAAANPELRLDVQSLPKGPFSSEFVRSLNDRFGILALAMEKVSRTEDAERLQGVPFLVPGGRFNELYGWDSYFESLGLLENGRIDIVRGIVINFCYCIKHYGKILNANRSYYLCRSQPPFLTDLALRLYQKIAHEGESATELLKYAILAAIKEYYTVWMAKPRYDARSGLSRYAPDGLGVPPETEPGHFEHLIASYNKLGIPFDDYIAGYNNGTIVEPGLDEYFRHDRGVRESGHDTSYRLDGKCADLATVDLNSLLYKYETDISRSIRHFFGDKLLIPDEFLSEGQVSGHSEVSSTWDRRAKKRRLLIDKLLWNESRGMYFDYNTKTFKQETYVSATTFWPLWAGLSKPSQASKVVDAALPLLEAWGGLAGSDRDSKGVISLNRPNRQWDFPYGWAPHQIMAWVGLLRYNHEEEAQRLTYKWLHMVLQSFYEYNGMVVEKYDVTDKLTAHAVDAEYGNQGSEFIGYAGEGFGWVNASYIFGLTLLTTAESRGLSCMADWDTYHLGRQKREDESGSMVYIDNLDDQVLEGKVEVYGPEYTGTAS